eukprot:6459366-Amphidinium_carterae.1
MRASAPRPARTGNVTFRNTFNTCAAPACSTSPLLFPCERGHPCSTACMCKLQERAPARK